MKHADIFFPDTNEVLRDLYYLPTKGERGELNAYRD
jgi:hypothetical protein